MNPRELGARCDICPLAGKIPVPAASSPEKVRLVIVGEFPSRNDEKMAAPFAGAQGGFLDERLRRDANVKRGECIITNAALCRGESDAEQERAAECCAPRLLRELAAVPAEVPIVALGKAATRSILGVRNILTARGFVWRTPEIDPKAVAVASRAAVRKPSLTLKAKTMAGRAALAGRLVLPSLHPSFMLRADTWKPIAELDFQRVGRVARDGFHAGEDECSYQVGGPEFLKKLGPIVSCDIETDGIRPLECGILSIGVADTSGNVVEIWPWRQEERRAGRRPQVEVQAVWSERQVDQRPVPPPLRVRR